MASASGGIGGAFLFAVGGTIVIYSLSFSVFGAPGELFGLFLVGIGLRDIIHAAMSSSR